MLPLHACGHISLWILVTSAPANGKWEVGKPNVPTYGHSTDFGVGLVSLVSHVADSKWSEGDGLMDGTVEDAGTIESSHSFGSRAGLAGIWSYKLQQYADRLIQQLRDPTCSSMIR